MNVISQLKSQIQSKKWNLTKVLLGSIFCTGLVFASRLSGMLEPWELSTFDWLITMREEKEEDRHVLVVGITEKDIQKTLQGQVISDQEIKQALGKLEQYNPKVIGVDIPLDKAKGLDDIFQNSGENNSIIVPCQLVTEKELAENPEAPGFGPPSIFNTDSENLGDFVGVVNVSPDPDNSIRRAILLISVPPNSASNSKNSATENRHLCNTPGDTLRTFAWSLVYHYFPEEEVKEPPPQNPNAPIQIRDVAFKKLTGNEAGYSRLPKITDYQILLNYRSLKKPIPEVSLFDILNNQVDRKQIEGKVVLFGYTALSKKDTFNTPFDKSTKTPGVRIHAQIVSQIINAVEPNSQGYRRHAQIFYFPRWGEWLWIWAWSIIGGLLTFPKIKPSYLQGILLLITTAGVFIICVVGLQFFAYWLPLIPSSIALVGSFALVLGSQYEKPIDYEEIREEEDKKKAQTEKKHRDEFLQELQKKAEDLSKKWHQEWNNQIITIPDDEILTIHDLEYIEPHDNINSNQNNRQNDIFQKFGSSLETKSQKIRQDFTKINVNSVDLKKAYIDQLIAESTTLVGKVEKTEQSS